MLLIDCFGNIFTSSGPQVRHAVLQDWLNRKIQTLSLLLVACHPVVRRKECVHTAHRAAAMNRGEKMAGAP